MRLLALFAAGLFAGTLVSADDKKDEKKVKDEEAILGTWRAEKVDEGGGKGAAAEQIAKMRMVFKKDGKLMTTGPTGDEVPQGYKLDPTAKPKAIDVTEDGSTWLGVYELDGDTLRICLAAQGKATRPTELKADGKTLAVITLKRVKEEKKDKKIVPPPAPTSAGG